MWMIFQLPDSKFDLTTCPLAPTGLIRMIIIQFYNQSQYKYIRLKSNIYIYKTPIHSINDICTVNIMLYWILFLGSAEVRLAR